MTMIMSVTMHSVMVVVISVAVGAGMIKLLILPILMIRIMSDGF